MKAIAPPVEQVVVKGMNMIFMTTINRRPIRTHVRYDGDVVIDWKCHGIDCNGNRIKWTERTFTARVFVESYDKELFADGFTHRTTKFIYPPGIFETTKGLQS